MQYKEFYPEINGSFSFEVDKVLYSERSPYQQIEIVESATLGKILLIDNLIMLTEKDEFIYHEMLTHVPLFSHPCPERILIIGGGDGGTVRECLKHKTIQHIDLVDIDEMVSQACLKFIPSVSSELNSPKVSCHFQDAVGYVKKTSRCYDIIIVDSTDPINVGEGLFTSEFYRNCLGLLTEGGILANQSESPIWHSRALQNIAQKLKSIFPAVFYYQAHIPTYPSGHWGFGFASKKYQPLKDFQVSRYQEYNLQLKYYNKDIHFSTFALPTFFRELVNGV